jgi:uncharacterized protein YaeQ
VWHAPWVGIPLRLNLDLRLRPADGAEVRTRLFLSKHAGESIEHVLMKLLAYALFYHPGLRVEVPVGQHHKPDLVRTDERGEPVQWIDCGETTLRKLERITRHNRRTRIDIVKPTARALGLYKDHADARLTAPERVRYVAFADGFLGELAARLSGRHTVEVDIAPGLASIQVTVDGEAVASPVIIRAGAGAAGAGG